MSQREKLLEKARRGSEISRDEFRTLAKHWGIEVIEPPGGGSHFRLFSPLTKRIEFAPIPGHGEMKRIYVKRLVEMIEDIEFLRAEQSSGERG